MYVCQKIVKTGWQLSKLLQQLKGENFLNNIVTNISKYHARFIGIFFNSVYWQVTDVGLTFLDHMFRLSNSSHFFSCFLTYPIKHRRSSIGYQLFFAFIFLQAFLRELLSTMRIVVSVFYLWEFLWYCATLVFAQELNVSSRVYIYYNIGLRPNPMALVSVFLTANLGS